MTQQQSFTQVENELIHTFRKQINEAESTEDVKKIFARCMQSLFKDVSSGRMELRDEDICLKPEDSTFHIGENIRSLDEFTKIWHDSDLPRIVERFTELAMHQHRHLAKNPAKTEAKIRR